MNKLVYYYLFLWAITSITAFVGQFFLPKVIVEGSIWNLSEGWQREIALWNLAIIFGIGYCLLSKKDEIARFMTGMLTFLCLLLGTNHLYAAFISSFAIIHVTFSLLNLILGVGLGIVALKTNKEK